MRFAAEAERFMRVGGDRLVGLASLLASRSLAYSVVKTGSARHLVLRSGKGKPLLTLVAHYDRVPGTSGALDNSCACLQLVDLATRLAARAAARGEAPALAFAFTDAEEAPGSGEASTQGAFALARAIAGGRLEGFRALVLDVTGRGRRLLLSTAPAELMARNGLSGSTAAEGHKALATLARRAAAVAGLDSPLDASLPWSDDLGLTLGGMPALAVSLLPDEEAELLAAGGRPPTWDILHTAADLPELAEGRAFETMAAFLDALAQCIKD